MIVKIPPGSTRVLGKAQGYMGLPVLDTVSDDGWPMIQTIWEPTPKELALLNAGGLVLLTVLGNNHPPVKMDVVNAQTDNN